MMFKYFENNSIALYDENTHMFLFEIFKESLLLCHSIGNTYDVNTDGTLIIEKECDYVGGLL